ncbi:MAG: hypothetical protein IT198_04855 [Acidimicrobiia bacterium]|nr:hypothetical protein [Acidimicrobiia bacterium]
MVAPLVLAACAISSTPGGDRISGPPDTGVSQAAEPPADGILAGGGTFRLSGVGVDLAECEQKPVEDPADFLRDPFNMEGEETMGVGIDAATAAQAGPFLESLLLQSDPLGTSAVMGAGLDPTQSLPWAGGVTRGRDDRFFAGALIVGIGDRVVDLDVKIPREVAAASTASAPAEYSLSWRESPALPRWLGDPGEAGATCVIEGSVTLDRTGPAPVRPERPVGVAGVGGVDPAPSDTAAAALAAIGSSSWETTDTGDVSLVAAGGAGVATGEYVLTGDAWLFQMKSTLAGTEFSVRAWKAEEGTVRGTLLAGGGAFFVELAG